MAGSAVSYLRVSGDSQIAGDGLPRQRDIIQKYAVAHDIQILDEFRDEGVTGKMELEGRAGLSACLQYCRENAVRLVLIEDATRMARDMIVAEVVTREFQKIGVRVISASGGVDLTAGDDSNPTAKLIRQILAAVSEFERCVITLKLRAARQRKKARGGRGDGRHAFGEKPSEVQTLEQIREWRATGASCQKIADDLNACGYKTRTGRPWRASVLAKILKRQNTPRFTAPQQP